MIERSALNFTQGSGDVNPKLSRGRSTSVFSLASDPLLSLYLQA
jgi:hypothetical protein